MNGRNKMFRAKAIKSLLECREILVESGIPCIKIDVEELKKELNSGESLFSYVRWRDVGMRLGESSPLYDAAYAIDDIQEELRWVNLEGVFMCAGKFLHWYLLRRLTLRACSNRFASHALGYHVMLKNIAHLVGVRAEIRLIPDSKQGQQYQIEFDQVREHT